MGKLVSLEEVNASVLPARVLVLLSKYAQSMRKHTGLVIKISSMNVFRHVHNTHKLTQHAAVRKLYRELLDEVGTHVAAGTMHTNYDRQLLKKRQSQQRTRTQHTGEILVPRKSFGQGVKAEGSLSMQAD